MLGDCLNLLDGLLVRWLSVGGTVNTLRTGEADLRF